jgi:hypothetical protein
MMRYNLKQQLEYKPLAQVRPSYVLMHERGGHADKIDEENNWLRRCMDVVIPKWKRYSDANITVYYVC